MSHATEADIGVRRGRIVGIDLARFVAIAGMVVIHASTDLVMLPVELASPDAVVPYPTEPDWAYWLQSLFGNRARPLFILLAGVGVSLLAARAGWRTKTMLLRAAYLFALGVLLLVIGWSDIVLVFYGIAFVASIWFRLLTDRWLTASGVVLLAVPVAFWGQAGGADASGIWLLVGELGYFVLGMRAGRALARDRDGAALTLVRVGALAAAPGLVYLVATGGFNVLEIDSAGELAAASSSTLGLCLLLLGALVELGARSNATVVAWLAVAGSMPLTLYVLHALAYTAMSGRVGGELGRATIIALAMIPALVAFALLWRRRWTNGPLEQLMRRIAG